MHHLIQKNHTKACEDFPMEKGGRNIPRVLALFLCNFAVIVALYEIPAGSQEREIVVEDFHGYSSTIFTRWLIRDAGKKEASSTYRLQSDGGNWYLAADSKRNSIQIARRVTWNLNTHPILTWRWRGRRLPTGGNESAGSTNDSAASIYVIFQRAKVPFLPWDKQPINVIKYVWSTTLPVGRVLHKSKEKLGVTIYEGRFVVLQSGNGRLGEWISERRNVLEDYRRLFGSAPPGNPILIAILTDSNATESAASADYDDITITAR